MTDANFSNFNYRNGDNFATSKARQLSATVLGLAGLALLLPLPWLGAPLALAALVVWFWGRQDNPGLMIGPRFLVCGKTVIYYRALSRVSTQEGDALVLVTRDARRLRISADRFPTNARKAPKIVANQAKKFAKARDKILARVRSVAPDTVVLQTARGAHKSRASG